MHLNSIEEIIADIRAGRMVVMMDDEDRENEGDLIMAASKVRPEDINFMARYARGLICLPMTRDRCKQLRLPLMVNDNQARFSTNFTVSIEAREGVTTGISAYDRAHTVRTAARPDASPDDLSQPGHIFPLMAEPGGVLTRAGHTEAGVDLACLAGLEPAAVLVEILNEDGSMARRPQLEKFAREHDLKIGTVADLIRYRMAHEKTVQRTVERDVATDFGSFRMVAYNDSIKKCTHVALVHGDLNDQVPLVRVHVPNPLSDALRIADESFGLPVHVAMEEIVKSDGGVLLMLGYGEELGELVESISESSNTPFNRGDNAASAELRSYGIGAQILTDLGVQRMRVLSAPKVFHGLSGFGLEVVDYVDPVHGSKEAQA